MTTSKRVALRRCGIDPPGVSDSVNPTTSGTFMIKLCDFSVLGPWRDSKFGLFKWMSHQVQISGIDHISLKWDTVRLICTLHSNNTELQVTTRPIWFINSLLQYFCRSLRRASSRITFLRKTWNAEPRDLRGVIGDVLAWYKLYLTRHHVLNRENRRSAFKNQWDFSK